jgi:hypothetical protein
MLGYKCGVLPESGNIGGYISDRSLGNIAAKGGSPANEPNDYATVARVACQLLEQ